MLVRFTLRLAVSEIQGRQKSEIHRMKLEHLTVKSTLYTLNAYP